jgi:hypothetical protein
MIGKMMGVKKIPCDGCDEIKTETNGWWLHEYYNFTGYFCSNCYDNISHDSYGKPKKPKEFLIMLLKLSYKE